MYSDELPAGLIKQITKMGDCTFVAVVQSHHLWRVKMSAASHRTLPPLFSPSCRSGMSWRLRDQNWGAVALGVREALHRGSHVWRVRRRQVSSTGQ